VNIVIAVVFYQLGGDIKYSKLLEEASINLDKIKKLLEEVDDKYR